MNYVTKIPEENFKEMSIYLEEVSAQDVLFNTFSPNQNKISKKEIYAAIGTRKLYKVTDEFLPTSNALNVIMKEENIRLKIINSELSKEINALNVFPLLSYTYQAEKQIQKTRLVFIGDNKKRNELVKALKNLKQEDNVF
jgi:hypothetical protein